MRAIETEIKLARKFAEKLQDEGVPIREIIDRNKARDNPLVCASHDFCDANITMHEAFLEVMGRDPLEPLDGMSAADMETWNNAWAIAVAADFFI